MGVLRERRRGIFLAYKDMFRGHKAQIPKSKQIRAVLDKNNQQDSEFALSLGYVKLIRNIKKLMKQGVFNSPKKARRIFPDLPGEEHGANGASNPKRSWNQIRALKKAASDSRVAGGDQPEHRSASPKPIVERAMVIRRCLTAKDKTRLETVQPDSPAISEDPPLFKVKIYPYSRILSKINSLTEDQPLAEAQPFFEAKKSFATPRYFSRSDQSPRTNPSAMPIRSSSSKNTSQLQDTLQEPIHRQTGTDLQDQNTGRAENTLQGRKNRLRSSLPSRSRCPPRSKHASR